MVFFFLGQYYFFSQIFLEQREISNYLRNKDKFQYIMGYMLILYKSRHFFIFIFGPDVNLYLNTTGYFTHVLWLSQ